VCKEPGEMSCLRRGGCVCVCVCSYAVGVARVCTYVWVGVVYSDMQACRSGYLPLQPRMQQGSEFRVHALWSIMQASRLPASLLLVATGLMDWWEGLRCLLLCFLWLKARQFPTSCRFSMVHAVVGILKPFSRGPSLYMTPFTYG
jgi:hypothetical protein